MLSRVGVQLGPLSSFVVVVVRKGEPQGESCGGSRYAGGTGGKRTVPGWTANQ